MRRTLTGLVAVGSLVFLLAGLALAQAKKPDATLSLTEGMVGAGITAMKNQNGVVIELRSTTQGTNFKLAAEGIKLSVQK